MKLGKSPVLWSEDARKLLNSIESSTLIGLRDCALIGTMVYSFAREEGQYLTRIKPGLP